MSIFKNTLTGDITTVYGEVADNFAARGDQELLFDDRDGSRDFATEGFDTNPDEEAAEPTEKPAHPHKPKGKQPEVSQDDTPTPDADGVDNPKE